MNTQELISFIYLFFWISFRVFLEVASCGLNDHISEAVEQ